jgi:hypothetical protein
VVVVGPALHGDVELTVSVVGVPAGAGVSLDEFGLDAERREVLDDRLPARTFFRSRLTTCGRDIRRYRRGPRSRAL